MAEANGAVGAPAKAAAEMLRGRSGHGAGPKQRGLRLSAPRWRLLVPGWQVPGGRCGFVSTRRQPCRRRGARQGGHAAVAARGPRWPWACPALPARPTPRLSNGRFATSRAIRRPTRLRWLLGRLALAASDRDRALSLWAKIGPGSTRWLDSRLEIAKLDRDELDRLQINPDRRRVIEQFLKADGFLDDCIRNSRTEADSVLLSLARARLDVTPGVDSKPEVTIELCDRIKRLPASPADQYRARLYRMIAQVELGRYVEAEREAQSHSTWRIPTEEDSLFDAVRLLDQCAASAQTDLRQRRYGLVLKLIVGPLLAASESMMVDRYNELAMRLTRSLLFTGADRNARRSLTAWKGSPPATSDRLLRDLGDTYNRLEVYSLDIDVQRLRLKNSAAGSMPWFDAGTPWHWRISTPAASRKPPSSSTRRRSSIPTSAAALHDKFIHLRQRLGVKP